MSSTETTGNEIQDETGEKLKDETSSLEDYPIRGWVKKKKKFMRSWKSVFTVLKGTEILYGKSEDDVKKIINLESAQVEECIDDSFGNHCFSVKEKDSKRTHYFQLEGEEEYREWLEAIYYAKIGKGKGTGNSEACVLQ